MTGEDERGGVHLADDRRAFQHVVCEQSRAIVEFCAKPASLCPNWSLTRERRTRIGVAFRQAGSFEILAPLLHDRAQVDKLVLHVEVESEQPAMDFVEGSAQSLDAAGVRE